LLFVPEEHINPNEPGRRLTVDFAGWLGNASSPPEPFFRNGLIVLDANVLLDLYRITPDARGQVIDTLSGIADRLWVPHQAAVEFSRNRRRVVEERTSSFKQTKQVLQSATVKAVDVLVSAVEQLIYQRERNGTTRIWDIVGIGLDRESLLRRFDGVMGPALSELETLMAEHDLHLQDMQGADPLLSQIDELLNGRIGPGYTPAGLRALVDEAHLFRFPNKIPPGYLDTDKETPLRAAGDFLLWRQTIDRAALMTSGDRLVLLITKDLKEDWWNLDTKKRPLGPRPELVQEIRDLTGASLLLLTLKEFLTGAKRYLASAVSDETLNELREVSEDIEELLPDVFRLSSDVPDLLSLTPIEFERLIQYLLIRMGHDVRMNQPSADGGIDMLIVNRSQPEVGPVAVQVKRYRSPISSQTIRELQGILFATSASSALLITTSRFQASAIRAAEDTPVELISGTELLQLLAKIGIHARIGFEIDPGASKNDR
jgi:HJR/Mrr/RecB family endonuclease